MSVVLKINFLKMCLFNEISKLIEGYSGTTVIVPSIDIFEDLGVTGDDFHELIDKYSKKFNVDMSNYLWYFHTNEEGSSIGSIFYKPPNERVKRIPVTPQMLVDFIKTKKWEVEYPKHEKPNGRIDIYVNYILLILFLIFIIAWLLVRYTA